MTEFVLDQESNPHPAMLNRALMLRRAAQNAPPLMDVSASQICAIGWLFYRDAMLDATGSSTAELEAWLDSHDVDLSTIQREIPIELGRKS